MPSGFFVEAPDDFFGCEGPGVDGVSWRESALRTSAAETAMAVEEMFCHVEVMIGLVYAIKLSKEIDLAMASHDTYSFATKYLESNPVDGWASLSTVINILKRSPELNGVKPLDIKNTVEQVFTEKFGPKEAANSAKPKGKVRVDAFVSIVTLISSEGCQKR